MVKSIEVVLDKRYGLIMPQDRNGFYKLSYSFVSYLWCTRPALTQVASRQELRGGVAH